MDRVHIKVNGRVQGVFFRAHTQEEAKSLGLTGWVRNTSDGGVETVAEGEKSCLEALVKWCRHGPPSSRVDSVIVDWMPATGEFSKFSIAY